MGLNESEYELVSLIEQEYHLSGCVPTKEVCLSKLAMSSKKYDSLYARDDFRNALISRGISLKILNGEVSNGVLTAQQLIAINTLLDLNDNRSDSKKLRDLGIATTTFQGWTRDPAFQEYWTRRTEALFGDALNEANRAIYDNVKRGDLGSIKLLFEMTGRWSSKPVAEMNIEWVLTKIMEILTKHITDEATLMAISNDLLGVQQEVVPVANNVPSSIKAIGAKQLEPVGFAL